VKDSISFSGIAYAFLILINIPRQAAKRSQGAKLAWWPASDFVIYSERFAPLHNLAPLRENKNTILNKLSWICHSQNP
jgi:hypothetical protein